MAANYTASAAWSAVDARRSARALSHLNRALYLAGMAKDPVAELRVWNSHAMLALHRGEFSQAVDAGQAAQATAVTRRDPLFASLAQARTAIGYSSAGDRRGALRSLGYAQEALTKASSEEARPSWVAFYGPAELLAITAIVRDETGDPAGAEAASHCALSAIPQHYRRNRALTTLQLATAQLHQRDVDQACGTADQVFVLMDGTTLPGRMRSYLGDFYRDLTTLAPGSSTAREWKDPLPIRMEPGSMTSALELRHYGHDDLSEIRRTLIDVHADVHAERMADDEFRQKFPWFVDHWGSNPGFACVIAYDGDEPAGFTYGAPGPEGREWWREHLDPAPEMPRTFHFSELMVREPWRKTGTAEQLHRALMDARDEALAALLVDVTHPKVEALYTSWGVPKGGGGPAVPRLSRVRGDDHEPTAGLTP